MINQNITTKQLVVYVYQY